MKRFKLVAILIATLLIVMTASMPAFAKSIGVGVNTGKIAVNEPMMTGGMYKLPSIGVINTGDIEGDYEIDIAYMQNQKELRPDKGWFSFSPNQFKLKPHQSQNAQITVTIPINAEPGKYFALIEGRPKMSSKGVTIGVAAATKLNFEVKQASLLWSIINRTKSFFTAYAPWSYIASGVVALIFAVVVVRKRFSFSFHVEKRNDSE